MAGISSYTVHWTGNTIFITASFSPLEFTVVFGEINGETHMFDSINTSAEMFVTTTLH